MDFEDSITLLFVVLLIIISVVTFAPTELSPFIITSPDTTSMEPTITTSDVVFVVSQSTYDTGDVILFSDETISQPILHRIVGEDGPNEYITQGDANEITDQESGLEAVTDEQIFGTVVEVNGSVLTIPYIGIIYSNTELLLLGWVGLIIVTLAGSNIKSERSDTHYRRDDIRAATVLVLLFAVLVVSLSMGLAATEEISYTVSDISPEGSQSIVGLSESKEQSITISNGLNFAITSYAVSDSEQIKVTNVERINLQESQVYVENEPQSQIGVINSEVSIYTYLRTLPRPVIYSLASIHPVLGSISTVGIPVIVLLILLRIFIDPKKPPKIPNSEIYKYRRKKR